MNEQANTRLVQQAYQSIAAGDIQALLNSFAENIEWELLEMENVPFAGTWQGHEGIRQFFGKVFEVQDVIEFEPEEYIAQGDKVVALGRFLMRIKATGRELARNGRTFGHSKMAKLRVGTNTWIAPSSAERTLPQRPLNRRRFRKKSDTPQGGEL
jgi:uncharacterized protein